MAARRRKAEPVQNPTPDQSAGTPLYQVTRVVDSTNLSPQGGFQRTKQVYFVLPNGTTSYIEVPLADFNRDTVQNLIDQHVGNLLEVMNIQGPTVPPTS